MSRLLNDAERERFATYLEQDAESDRLIIEQLEIGNNPGLKTLIQIKKIVMQSKIIVAKELRAAESQTIEPDGRQ
jgi:hypothetical protein